MVHERFVREGGPGSCTPGAPAEPRVLEHGLADLDRKPLLEAADAVEPTRLVYRGETATEPWLLAGIPTLDLTITSDQPGECPICHMDLEPIPETHRHDEVAAPKDERLPPGTTALTLTLDRVQAIGVPDTLVVSQSCQLA